MAAILKVWRQIENLTPSIDSIYLKNNPAKFYPDPIWNDGALRASPQQEQQQDE